MIGLPSLQAMDRAQETRIWLASEVMDMRCGFDRLAERVRAVIGEDPLSGHWFVFHSREGARTVELRASELAMILDGIDVAKLKRVPRYERTARNVEGQSSKEKISA